MTIEEQVRRKLEELEVREEAEVARLFQKLREQMDRELRDLAASDDGEQFRVRWLGRKRGILTAANDNWLKPVVPKLKRSVGRLLNELKQHAGEALETRRRELEAAQEAALVAAQRLDVTLPGVRRTPGARHPVQTALEEIQEIFLSMGYSVEVGPEIETDYYNFEALNIPRDHPARDAQDTLSAGIISRVNKAARAAGCGEGMPCLDAALALRDAPPPSAAPEYAEARHVVGRTQAGLRLVCMDSISLVAEGEDDGQIVLSGSHCGIVASQPHFVIGVDAAAAFFNDAGIGKDSAGITRLPALDARGIAGATVAAMSARIGDGRSTYSDGIVSRVNETARAAGIEPGMTAREAVTCIGIQAGGVGTGRSGSSLSQE